MRCLAALGLFTLVLIGRGVPAGAAASSNEATMAREIANDINNERAARHLPAIPFDAGSYSSGAQRVAEHNRETDCRACHSADHPSGEVVWWGSNYPSSGSPIWWMGSPPHRALLLAPAPTKLGVGVACNGTEHYAVAWIETQDEAQAASPEPVATKEGTGTRCNGQTSPTRTTVEPGAPAVTSPPTTAAARRGATTIAAANGDRTATTTRRSTSTTRGKSTETSAQQGSTGTPDTPFEVAASPAVDASPRQAIVVSSASSGGRGDMGTGATAALLATFAGALVIGRLSHRRRS